MNEHEAFAALIKRDPSWLDRPIQDLVKMAAVGSVYVTTHRSLLTKIKAGQIGLAEEDRKTKLAEGQAIGVALLDVEARIGELSLATPQIHPPGAGRGARPSGEPLKHERLGLRRKQMGNAQAIARHPEAVERVIAEAKENEDIPTKTAVLNKIRLDAERERRIRAEAREKPEIVISLEEQNALDTLEWLVAKCPREWPKNWHEAAFQRACGYAKILIKRLEVLVDGQRRESITE